MNSENCKCIQVETPQIVSIKTLIFDILEASEDIRAFSERANAFVANAEPNRNQSEEIENNCMIDSVRKIQQILIETQLNLVFLSKNLGM